MNSAMGRFSFKIYIERSIDPIALHVCAAWTSRCGWLWAARTAVCF